MNKIFTPILIFFLAFISSTLFGQLEPVPLSFQYGSNIEIYFDTATVENDDVFEKNYVTNTSDEEIGITWVRAIDYSPNSQWSYAICDKKRCYFPSIDTEEFVLEQGEKGELTTHLYLNNFYEGDSAIVYLNLFRNDIDNSDSLYMKTAFNNGQKTSTVNVVKRNDVTVYPNPAAQYFNIKSPSNIGRVIVHDILGEKLMMLNLNGQHNRRIDISDLQSGTYFVSAFDTEGKRLKTTRLLKRSVSP